MELDCMKANGKAQRIELGRFIVADPKICHGKPTYKGTRIMVWQVLEALGDGESVEQVAKAWGRRISREAVLETIRLAGTNLLNGRGKLRHRNVSRLAA
jgi:uncharacterized protein (DUF433 family)